jgi:hypothetical protein
VLGVAAIQRRFLVRDKSSVPLAVLYLVRAKSLRQLLVHCNGQTNSDENEAMTLLVMMCVDGVILVVGNAESIMVQCRECKSKVKSKDDRRRRLHKDRSECRYRATSPSSPPPLRRAPPTRGRCKGNQPSSTTTAAAAATTTPTAPIMFVEEVVKAMSHAMLTLHRNGCAELGGCLVPKVSELKATASYVERQLSGMERQEGPVVNGNGERWCYNFEIRPTSSSSLPFSSAEGIAPNPVELMLRLVFTFPLLGGIAAYLRCSPSELLLDSVCAVQMRGGAQQQLPHADHAMGPRTTVVLVISLTDNWVSTRFHARTHTQPDIPFEKTIAPAVLTRYYKTIDARFVVFDGAIHHMGAARPARSDEPSDAWFGRDRIFVTISRPLSPEQRMEYAQFNLTAPSPRTVLSLV